MSEVSVVGVGAVSSAGWGVPALRMALDAGRPLPVVEMPRPGWNRPLRVRRVPVPPVRPAFLAHPRLRRASSISHFAVAAAIEALDQDWAAPPATLMAGDRLGLVFCTMTGSVVYSRRFYSEVRRDPATASPLLFPETVYNAPASHLATLLGIEGRVHTEVGDASCALGAFATASLWLEMGVIDRCLIVASEELDWLTADGLDLHCRRGVATEGAGAVVVARPGTARPLAQLDLGGFGARWHQAPGTPVNPPQRDPEGEFQVDDRGRDGGEPSGARGGWEAPRTVLGEGWAAATVWQCVAAILAVAGGEAIRAQVTVTDSSGRKVAVRFAAPARPSGA